MRKKKRHYVRPLRKAYRPWQSPLDPERIENVSPPEDPPRVENEELTAEEWERIWRNTSG